MTVLSSHADAFVNHDPTTDVWSIGSAAVAISVGFGPGHELQLWQVLNMETGRRWAIAPEADAALTLASVPTTLGDALTFSGATAERSPGGVRLTIEYLRADIGVRVRRVYACASRSPMIETWLHVESSNPRPIRVAGLTTWRGTMDTSPICWMNGLQDDGAVDGHAFRPQYRDLGFGEQVTLGSDGRSSERFVPIAAIDGGADAFVIGSMWSGAWQMAFHRRGTQLTATIAYPRLTTSVVSKAPVESPHTFFGIASGGVAAVPAALQRFIDTGLRKAHQRRPLVPAGASFAGRGLCVEPERVILRELGDAGAPDPRWLATTDGDYGSADSGQVCLGCPAARAWMLERLTALVDTERPDYLKWDNTLWVECNAAGHDHGPFDGSFAHIHGLYAVVEELRARYPDLLIDNVSRHRLDYGWLRYSDRAVNLCQAGT